MADVAAGGGLAGPVLYDDPAFFARYRDLRAAGDGLNQDIEQPALAAMLPDVRGGAVLELGCGDGALARRLAEAGARQVVAVDASTRMLAVAARPMTGWLVADGGSVWPVDHYSEETSRAQEWLGRTVVKHHRRLTTVVGGVLAAGLTLTGLDEPQPDAEAIGRRPAVAQHRRRPPLLVVAARKPV